MFCAPIANIITFLRLDRGAKHYLTSRLLLEQTTQFTATNRFPWVQETHRIALLSRTRIGILFIYTISRLIPNIELISKKKTHLYIDVTTDRKDSLDIIVYVNPKTLFIITRRSRLTSHLTRPPVRKVRKSSNPRRLSLYCEQEACAGQI